MDTLPNTILPTKKKPTKRKSFLEIINIYVYSVHSHLKPLSPYFFLNNREKTEYSPHTMLLWGA